MIGEICVSLVIFFLSLFLYIHSYSIESLGSYQEIGPEVWPQIILIGLMICSAILTVRYIMQWKRSQGEQAASEDVNWSVFAIIFVSFFGYILLLKTFGYIFLTPFLIIIVMFVVGARKVTTYIYTILGIMLLLYFAFVEMLLIPLPKGQGIFRSLSIFLGL